MLSWWLGLLSGSEIMPVAILPSLAGSYDLLLSVLIILPPFYVNHRGLKCTEGGINKDSRGSKSGGNKSKRMDPVAKSKVFP